MEYSKQNSNYPIEDWENFEQQVSTLDAILMGKSLFDDQQVENPTQKTAVNRTCLNVDNAEDKKTLNNLSSSSLSQNAFMKMVEDDANRRSKERAERNNEADKLKTAGNHEFKQENYEKAMYLFTKALELRRDSSILYLNRALTYMRLGLFGKCVQDCDSALKLKDTLKCRLIKVKALFKRNDKEASEKLLEETRNLYPDHFSIINDYLKEWKKEEEC